MKRIFFPIFLLLLLASCQEPLPANESLIDYWNYRAELSPEERKEQALDNLASSDDDYLLALSYFQLALFQYDSGQHLQEYEAYNDALYHLERSEVPDDKLYTYILQNQGWVAKKLKQYEKAAELYQRAFLYAKEYDYGQYLNILYNTAIAYKYTDTLRAMETFHQLLKTAREASNTKNTIRSLRQLGEIALSQQRPDEAERYIKEALRVVNEQEEPNAVDKRIRAGVFHSLSMAAYYREDYRRQEAFLNEALALGVASKTFSYQTDLAECYLKQGRKSEAYALLLRTEPLFAQQPVATENIRIYDLLAEAGGYEPQWYHKARKATEAFLSLQEAVNAELNETQLLLLVREQRKEQELSKVRGFFTGWIVGLIVSLVMVGLVLGIYYKKWLRLYRTIKKLHEIVS
ncbi:MAG: lipoprotein [Bacteroidota bacterium]